MTDKATTKPRFATQWKHPVSESYPDTGPSQTEQAHKRDSDINYLLAKYKKTGELPKVRQGMYADLSKPIDFQAAQNVIAIATHQFEELPARLRARFYNSPKEFLEFATNPANAEEMVSLGLATKRPAQPKGTASNEVSTHGDRTREKEGKPSSRQPSKTTTPRGGETTTDGEEK